MAASWGSRARRKGLELPLARCLRAGSEWLLLCASPGESLPRSLWCRSSPSDCTGGWPRHWRRSPCRSPTIGWCGSGELVARSLSCALIWAVVVVPCCCRAAVGADLDGGLQRGRPAVAWSGLRTGEGDPADLLGEDGGGRGLGTCCCPAGCSAQGGREWGRPGDEEGRWLWPESHGAAVGCGSRRRRQGAACWGAGLRASGEGIRSRAVSGGR